MVPRAMKTAIVRSGLFALTLGSVSFMTSAAIAQSQSMAAHYGQEKQGETAIPTVLGVNQQEHYRTLFAAIDLQDWEQVEDMLAKYNGSLLHQTALAEYYTHAKSPKVEAEQIEQWFELGVHLPQSEQIGRMGEKRGLESLPHFPQANRFARQPYPTKRSLPRSIVDGSMPSETRSAILDRIKNDDPAGANELLSEIDAQLTPESRAEWRQRVAWSYYIENFDTQALNLAETAREGSGPWVAEGEWVAGLAAWRLNQCALASEAFDRSAIQSTNDELTAAAHYWAHRALVRCREPEEAERHLTAAARFEETMYGMLAADQLGVEFTRDVGAKPFTEADWRELGAIANVRVAAALVEIGRPSLADEVLRHEVRTGNPAHYDALARLARHLGLPATQLFMAYNAPYGQRSDQALRYPVARWKPSNGWRVDPALAFAHALQESNFRAGAVSHANARGLMQITPITVREHAPRLNMSASYVNLNDPEVNLAFGQRNLEMLRDSYATEGKLPKIMAAYNAGLSPLIRWNTEINDQNDALLWMESIPYWETRSYVAIVMRNYWMYERAAGVSSPSRRALAQGLWPVFPDMATARTARLQR